MSDGSKRRRRQGNTPRARYYSLARGLRFNRRFGTPSQGVDILDYLKKWGLNTPQKETH